ncbi:MAG: glycosyltransferase family 2 protein [Neisseriaceae bacterium]
MLTISALIIAKNEGRNIVSCIQSVAFCQEIIVIDDESEDDTVALAQAAGAVVYSRAMRGDYSAQQNYAISKAKGDWLLFIDSDERVTPRLKKELQRLSQGPLSTAYRIKRLNYFGSKRLYFGPMRADYVTRFLPRNQVQFRGRVHQQLQHSYLEKKIKKGGLLHYTYENWGEYYAKFERYTRLCAEKYLEEGRGFSFFLDLILRPFWAFFNMYFLRLGILDGKLGWILAKNHYFYTYTKYVRFYYLKYPLN